MFNAVSFMAVLFTLLLVRASELVPVARDREPQPTLTAIRDGLSARGAPLMRAIVAAGYACHRLWSIDDGVTGQLVGPDVALVRA